MRLVDNIIDFSFKTKKSNEVDHKVELDSWLGESILDPIRKGLAQDVWEKDGERIKSKHREYILKTLNDWLKKMDVDEEPKSVAIIGSMTTYQYNDQSDIDINVVIDVPDSKRKELLKFLPNLTNLPGTEHPVNYYIAEDAGENVKKKPSSYDLLNDKWIKKPKEEDVEIPHSYVLEIARFFMDGMDSRVSEYERDKMELELYKSYQEDKTIQINEKDLDQIIRTKEMEVRADLDALYVALKMLKAFRGEAFEEDYEPKFLIRIETENRDFSVNNIVYKTIERFGYLDKLQKYKKIRDGYKEE